MESPLAIWSLQLVALLESRVLLTGLNGVGHTIGTAGAFSPYQSGRGRLRIWRWSNCKMGMGIKISVGRWEPVEIPMVHDPEEGHRGIQRLVGTVALGGYGSWRQSLEQPASPYGSSAGATAGAKVQVGPISTTCKSEGFIRYSRTSQRFGCCISFTNTDDCTVCFSD
jgi:hypothetical protein